MLIVFRVDGSSRIGVGHVMRCLALAQEFRTLGAKVEFICRRHTGNLIRQIEQDGFLVHALPSLKDRPTSDCQTSVGDLRPEDWLSVSVDQDIFETSSIVKRQEPDWLVIDHYGIDIHWESQLHELVPKIMVIEDLTNRSHNCEVILNQNFFSRKFDQYRGRIPPDCVHFVGPEFALLRPEFIQARLQRQQTGKCVERVLLFFGADPPNVTTALLITLSHPDFDHLKVDVVLSAGSIHRDAVAKAVAKHPNARLHIQTEEISALMIESDLCIGAGGVSMLERLCVGLPSLVVTIASNQERSSLELFREGYLVWHTTSENLDLEQLHAALENAVARPFLLEAIAKKGMELVTGSGARIVAEFIVNGNLPNELNARHARLLDCETYWDWANDELVRINAFQSSNIEWETHREWFQKKMSSNDSRLIIAESAIGPVGQVRFDRVGEFWVVDFSVARQFRGHDRGQEVLALAIELFRKSSPAPLVAEVKEENCASVKVFQKLGFSEISVEKTGVRGFKLTSDRPS